VQHTQLRREPLVLDADPETVLRAIETVQTRSAQPA
jgi:hypothetical protein